MSEEVVPVPKYYYDALLAIALLAQEHAEASDLVYKKRNKLNEAVFKLKRPELEEQAK